MRASSTLNTLTVNPEAHINFADPPSADPFKTLVINNLFGTGGIFGMNVDLGLVKGDLIDILTKSQGEHLLTLLIVIRKQIFRHIRRCWWLEHPMAAQVLQGKSTVEPSGTL
jgi:hypothetical protein